MHVGWPRGSQAFFYRGPGRLHADGQGSDIGYTQLELSYCKTKGSNYLIY